MKRKLFLGGGAALVAGCSGGGSTGSSPLPPAAPAAVAQNSPTLATTSATASGAVGSYPYRFTTAAMTSPILGEAGIPPAGMTPSANWMPCDGRVLAISKYRALFAVLGKDAGGDGKTTFALPKTKGPYYVAVAGSQPSSPTVLAIWRKGANAVRDTPVPIDFFDGVKRVSPVQPSPPAFVPAAAPLAVAPDRSHISEHARFSQALASLALDDVQRAKIADITARARSAATGAERRANVDASMNEIVTSLLRDDQRASLESQLQAWRSIRGG